MQPKTAIDYSPGAVYHEQRKHLAQQTLQALKLVFSLYGEPTSLLDVGCGHGVQIGYCRSRKIDAIGVDLSVPEDESGRHLLHHDLRVPLDLGVVFECVLCWEVAEHLPASAAETLCDTLARHVNRPSGRLLFTAATPGQAGPGHIHTQPHAYWRGLLEQRGLHCQDSETAVLSKLWTAELPRAKWYGKNCQVFAWT